MSKVREALFRLLTRLAVRHGVAVLLVTGALSVLGALAATTLQVKTNTKEMLGPGDPTSELLDYVEENFSGARTVRILLEGPDPERLVEVAKELEARLTADDHVAAVYLEAPVDFFLENLLLFLDVDDLRLLTTRAGEREDLLGEVLADPSAFGMLELMDAVLQEQARPSLAAASFQARVQGNLDLGVDPSKINGGSLGVTAPTAPLVAQLRQELISKMRDVPLPGSSEATMQTLRGGTEFFRLMADVLERGDTIDAETFAQRVRDLRDLQSTTWGAPVSRYALSPDGQALIFDVVPAESIAEIPAAQAFLAWLGEQLDAEALRNPDVRMGVTGAPVLAAEENTVILDNFLFITILGFIGILAVFIIGFERVGLPSLSAVPLIMGVTWTFGALAVFRGAITVFSLSFPVMLLGIGIDFAIHLLSGYAEQRRQGKDIEAALQSTFDTVGAGLLTGALTTALAFLVMMASGFFGLEDMGFAAGVGVLFALVAMLTALPALVVMWDRSKSAQGELLPNVPFPFLGPLGRFLQQARFPILAVFLMITLVFTYFVSAVRIDGDYMRMLPQDLPSARTQQRILEHYGTSNEFVLFWGDDMDEVERIRKAAERASTVAEVLSPSMLIPRDQQLKAPLLSDLEALLSRVAPDADKPVHAYDAADIARLRDALASVKVSVLQLSAVGSLMYDAEVREALGELRDVVNRVDARLSPASAGRLRHLDQLLAAEVDHGFGQLQTMASKRQLLPDDLPDAIQKQLRGEDGAWVVVVRGNGNPWDRTFREAFLEDLQMISEHHVGVVVAWDRGLNALLNALPRVMVMTGLVVFLLVWADLRSLRSTVLAMVPLTVGLLWTLGTMGMLDIPFNIVSAVSIPLLVGIGIDHGVHIYHRIRHDGRIDTALEHSGKPVLLTSMTTAIGFGTLMLSVHPGFYGLGLATTIGVVACLVVSLFLLPAMVAIFDEDALHHHDPAQDEEAR